MQLTLVEEWVLTMMYFCTIPVTWSLILSWWYVAWHLASHLCCVNQRRGASTFELGKKVGCCFDLNLMETTENKNVQSKPLHGMQTMHHPCFSDLLLYHSKCRGGGYWGNISSFRHHIPNAIFWNMPLSFPGKCNLKKEGCARGFGQTPGPSPVKQSTIDCIFLETSLAHKKLHPSTSNKACQSAKKPRVKIYL